MPLIQSRWTGALPTAALAILFAVVGIQNFFENQRGDFEIASLELAGRVQNEFRETEELLQAVTALYRSSEEVTQAEFSDFVHLWLAGNPFLRLTGVVTLAPEPQMGHDLLLVQTGTEFADDGAKRLAEIDTTLSRLLSHVQSGDEDIHWEPVEGNAGYTLLLAYPMKDRGIDGREAVVVAELDPRRLMAEFPGVMAALLTEPERAWHAEGDDPHGIHLLHRHHQLSLGDRPLLLEHSESVHLREVSSSLTAMLLLMSAGLLYSIYRVIRNTQYNAHALAVQNREIEDRVAQQTRELRRYADDLEQLRNALDQHSIVSVADVHGTIIQVNQKFIEVSGYSREELVGANHRILKSGMHEDAFYEDMWATISLGEVWQGEICNRNRSGGLYWVESSIVPLLDEHGIPYRYISIRTDITHLKQVEADLRESKEIAERASRAKSEFLSRMSHELRTPMNAILGFSQLLEENLDGNLSTTEQDFVREILNAGGHLLDLINEILDLTRIETGRISLAPEPLELGPLLVECKSLLLPMADPRGIGIALPPTDSGHIQVLADRMRLKEILLNLLSNAIKYNRDGGQVTIRLEHGVGNRLRVSIEDTGAGIARERQNELFQPFNRLDAEGRGIEGTGIGLVIAQRLIQLMQGDIGFRSEPGTGSLFWIEIPLANRGACTAPPEEKQPPRCTVLYVDDNSACLRLMEEFLERRSGCTLITAGTSSLGLELAIHHRPMLILLDINLPDMNGFALYGRLREHPELTDVPVVAVTGNADPRQREMALAMGFRDYLAKPVNFAVLQDILSELLPVIS